MQVPMNANPVLGHFRALFLRILPPSASIEPRYNFGATVSSDNQESVISAADTSCGGSPEIEQAVASL